MGVVYIGALSLVLLIVGVLRGLLGERQIRFFTVAWVIIVLYALGWYTPVFRGMYEVLPGVSFYRRPADAVFLIGAIGAILAGYVAHRLMTDAMTAALPSRQTMAAVSAALFVLFALAVLFAVIFGRLEQAVMPLLVAALWLPLRVLR